MRPLAELDARGVSALLTDIDDTLTSEGKLTAEAYSALERWRRVESSPLTSREVKIAAQGVVRTCEGIVAALVPARV